MFRQGRFPAGLIIAGALAASVACNDHRTTTAPLAPSDARFASAAEYVKFRMVELSANTLRIDGAAVSASVKLNPGPSSVSDISIRAEIVQGSTSRRAASLPVQCAAALPAGVVPPSGCDMSIALTASNSAPGSGTLVKGGAVVVLHLLWTVGGVETELDTRKVDVTLKASPVISALSLNSTTLAIDGPTVGWTATLQNPSNPIQNAALQGTIVQGATRRAAGGALVTCTTPIGMLPAGTCTVSFSASASNTAAGNGTLVAGPAVFELRLFQTANGAATTLDTRTVAVTLVPITPRLENLALSTTTLPIGQSVNYTVQIENPGLPLTDVGIQGEMVQDVGNGVVIKGAGGTILTCGPSQGSLPTGTCTMQFTVIALDNSAGGSFVPGPASFILRLYRAPVGGTYTEFDVETVAVTLASPNPTITSLTPTSTDITLDAGYTSYTAVLENPGPTRSITGIQLWISQGSARRAAGGTQVRCDGGILGDLPTGTCNTPGDIVAFNGQSAGTGTLVLGPATLEIELKIYDGVTDAIVDTHSIPINLVAP